MSHVGGSDDAETVAHGFVNDVVVRFNQNEGAEHVAQLPPLNSLSLVRPRDDWCLAGSNVVVAFPVRRHRIVAFYYACVPVDAYAEVFARATGGENRLTHVVLHACVVVSSSPFTQFGEWLWHCLTHAQESVVVHLENLDRAELHDAAATYLQHRDWSTTRCGSLCLRIPSKRAAWKLVQALHPYTGHLRLSVHQFWEMNDLGLLTDHTRWSYASLTLQLDCADFTDEWFDTLQQLSKLRIDTLIVRFRVVGWIPQSFTDESDYTRLLRSVLAMSSSVLLFYDTFDDIRSLFQSFDAVAHARMHLRRVADVRRTATGARGSVSCRFRLCDAGPDRPRCDARAVCPQPPFSPQALRTLEREAEHLGIGFEHWPTDTYTFERLSKRMAPADIATSEEALYFGQRPRR